MMTALWGGGVVLAASGACMSRLGLEVSAEWGEGVMMTALWGGDVVLAASGACRSGLGLVVSAVWGEAVMTMTALQVVLRFRKVLRSLCSSPNPAIPAKVGSSAITPTIWLQSVCRSSFRAASLGLAWCYYWHTLRG